MGQIRGFIGVVVLVVCGTICVESISAASRKVELRVGSTGDVELAGVLLLPPGDGPFPAVVLTHGSEPGRRNNPAYLRTAEAFRQKGLAVVVFDKRGVGDSTGTYVEAPDLLVPAEDVLAWVDMLRSRDDIRNDAIGVLGWSQGGWVGPLAASRSSHLAFVVSISGPGVSPLEQNIYDKTNQARAAGATPEQAREFSRVIRLVWTYIVTGDGLEAAQQAWDGVQNERWFKSRYNGPPMMDRERLLADPRMEHYVAHSSYDPVPILSSLKVPMLAVFGGADTIVPVEASVQAMRAAFARGKNPGLTIRVFEGADHGLRIRASDGSRAFAPGLLEVVIAWVTEQI